MKLPNRSRLSSIVGLDVSDGQLRAALVGRAKGGPEATKTVSAPLALEILHPAPELVGREIRNLLEGAGMRERHCIAAVPLRWVMSHSIKVPELSPEDTASFLQLEAEKGFPVDPSQLQTAHSFHRSAHGVYVTQLAVRKEQLVQYETVLKAAGLKPVSFTLGLAALPGAIPKAGTGRITVSAESGSITILVAAGGGIVSLRTCAANVDTEAGESLVNGAAVGRELRISLEQVPAELRHEVKSLHLVGEAVLVGQLADSLRDWAQTAGLFIDTETGKAESLGVAVASQLGGRWLESAGVDLEFLPPHPSRWSQLLARYNSKRLAATGFAVAAIAVLTLLAFSWQAFRLVSLRSQWRGMQAQVVSLQAVQGRIADYAPFYDTSFRTLTILKRVTECFPDNGSVTAKTFEIRGNSTVSISGTARDNASLLRALDQLRKAREVRSLKVEQIRGKTPAQFTFTFRWNANPGT